ncbi:MAG: hypothetical protein ACPG4M_00020 [Alphaproteobacteria bacterium]
MTDPIIDDDEIDETTTKEEGGTRWLVIGILLVSALGLGWALFFRPEGWPAPDFLSVWLAPVLLIGIFGGSYFLTRGKEWTALLRSAQDNWPEGTLQIVKTWAKGGRRLRRVDHGIIKNALYEASIRSKGDIVVALAAGRSRTRWLFVLIAAACAAGVGYLLLASDRTLFGVMWFQALVFSAVMVAMLTTKLGQWLTPPFLRRRFLLSTPEAVYSIAGLDKDAFASQVMFHIARNERRLDLRVSPSLSDTAEKAQIWADIATSFAQDAYDEGLDKAACKAVAATADVIAKDELGGTEPGRGLYIDL